MFENFIPQVWSAEILTELEKLCVFAEDCHTDYTGNVKQFGDAVKIRGLASPKITVITKAQRKTNLPPAESIEDTSVVMYINVMATFNYNIDDIDAAQADGNIKSVLNTETSAGIADEIDQYISSVCAGDDVKKLFSTPKKLVSGTPAEGEVNILTLLDVMHEKLLENNVRTSTYVSVTLSPAAHRLFKEAYTAKDTDNHDLMKNGKVGMYNGITVKMSNNVHKTTNGGDTVQHIVMRTKKAVAYAKPRDAFVEAMRSHNEFADNVRGYVLYDAMVVKPKEIIDGNVIVPDFAA